MTIDKYTFSVNEFEGDFVGTCKEFPSISWCAETKEEALREIKTLVTETLADLKKSGEPVPESQPYKVRVYAYEDKIVFVPNKPEEDISVDRWWPTSPETGGCVLMDSKKDLATSLEALFLMQTVKKNRDAIGDLNWWKCDNGQYAFSWWGPLFRVVDPDTSEAARDFRVHEDQCAIIENALPPEVLAGLKAMAPSAIHWKEPTRIDCKMPEDEDE